MGDQPETGPGFCYLPVVWALPVETERAIQGAQILVEVLASNAEPFRAGMAAWTSGGSPVRAGFFVDAPSWEMAISAAQALEAMIAGATPWIGLGEPIQGPLANMSGSAFLFSTRHTARPAMSHASSSLWRAANSAAADCRLIVVFGQTASGDADPDHIELGVSLVVSEPQAWTLAGFVGHEVVGVERLAPRLCTGSEAAQVVENQRWGHAPPAGLASSATAACLFATPARTAGAWSLIPRKPSSSTLVSKRLMQAQPPHILTMGPELAPDAVEVRRVAVPSLMPAGW